MDILEHPRYKDKPAILFFENFILDLIGQLEPERQEYLASLNLHKVFNTKATEWREVVREALQLSDTIEIAILDRWLRLQEANDPIAPLDFAMQFSDDYFADNSTVDVWDEATFCEAVSRIEKYYEGDASEIVSADVIDSHVVEDASV